AIAARTSDRERLAAAAALRRVRIAELEAAAHQVVLEVDLRAVQVEEALRVADDADAFDLVELVDFADLVVEPERVRETGTAAALHAHAERGDVGQLLVLDDAPDVLNGAFGEGDH